MLADIDLPHEFPLPPNLNSHPPDQEFAQTERSWYYYLGEIASRHLINRLLGLRRQLRRHSNVEPTPEDLRRLLSHVDVMEAQLLTWHTSLPPSLSFERPVGTLRLLPDELTQILQMRYLTICELLYQPFIRICLEHRLDVDPVLRTSITEIASRGLSCQMSRLQVISPYRHQGTWFGLRSIASSTLVLAAASKAQRNPNLLGAADLVIPDEWRKQASMTIESMNRFWSEENGGIRQMKRLVDWALSEFADETIEYV